MLSSEIDLRNNSHLEFLQFNLHFEEKEKRSWRGNMLRWLSSVCESVTCKSLIVELYGLYADLRVCNKIQDILLNLHTRTETLSVFLSRVSFPGQPNIRPEDVRKLFPRLYKAGIVVESSLYLDEQVSGCLTISRLPILTVFMLSLPWLSVNRLDPNSPFRCV